LGLSWKWLSFQEHFHVLGPAVPARFLDLFFYRFEPFQLSEILPVLG
jgi:hypothetical protein